MRTPGRTWLLALAAALALPACAQDAGETEAAGEDEMSEVRGRLADDTRDADEMAEQVGDTRLVLVESPEFGAYVAAGDDRPVYLFTADEKGEASSCFEDCAEAWPPVTGKVEVGPALDMALVGTITRPDGTSQVTYNGWPLYKFVRDVGADEPTGQEVESFGGEWYLVDIRGTKVDGDSGPES